MSMLYSESFTNLYQFNNIYTFNWKRVVSLMVFFLFERTKTTSNFSITT
jgi:hypothetical protein